MCSHNAQVNFKLPNSSCQMIRELQAGSSSTRGVCLIKFTPHLDLLYVLYAGGVCPHFLTLLRVCVCAVGVCV